MGWGKPGQEDSFSELGYGLQKQRKWLAGSKKTRKSKQILGKWNWRLAIGDNPSWKKLIKLKYGLEVREWFSKDPKGSFGVGL